MVSEKKVRRGNNLPQISKAIIIKSINGLGSDSWVKCVSQKHENQSVILRLHILKRKARFKDSLTVRYENILDSRTNLTSQKS